MGSFKKVGLFKKAGFFKKIAISIVSLILFALITAFVWMKMPVPSAVSATDPSIEFANTLSDGGAQFEGDFFEYNDINMHYVSAGEGDVILFLHGFPSFWYSLIRPMMALKDDYRVVAIDGPGKGLSDVPTDLDSFSMENMTSHIVALIDHLGADKVHLVGHDWGNALAFGIAQRYPQRVITLTGMSAPPQSVLLELVSTNEEQRQIFSYVDYFRKANPLLLWAMNVEDRIYQNSFKPLVDSGFMTVEEGSFFRAAASNPKRVNAHINWYRANLPPFDELSDKDFWPQRKARVTAPTLFIWGQDDHLITQDTITELSAVTEKLVLLELEGVGHRPQFERADDVIKAIREHVAQNP